MAPCCTDLIIVVGEEAKQNDNCFAAFAEFLGLSPRFLKIDAFTDGIQHERACSGEYLNQQTFVAIDIHTIASAQAASRLFEIRNQAKVMFVYGCAPGEPTRKTLNILTESHLGNVHLVAGPELNVHVKNRSELAVFPVAGQSFAFCGAAHVFETAPESEAWCNVIEIDNSPLCIRSDSPSITRFYLAGEQLVDINATVSRDGHSFRQWYPHLIALAIALKSNFTGQYWKTTTISANLIIDDPYLRESYGFVKYRSLISEIRQNAGALTIAFIPYNYKRSDPKLVKFLLKHSDHFSIAVHGCDHTAGEYSSTDSFWLKGTTELAKNRMETHLAITGMPYDNVMVFPQGCFSVPAIAALGHRGFYAAVNSSPWPTDRPDQLLSLKELLKPSIDLFGGLPLFLRRYPTNLFDFAFDALFEKPILVVEHHEYFKDGTAPCIDLFRRLGGLSGGVHWMPLGALLGSYCLWRESGTGNVLVRHFCPELVFRNTFDIDRVFQFEKSDHLNNVQAVLLNGTPIPFQQTNDLITYSAHITAGSTVKITLRPANTSLTGRHTSVNYRINVFTRRKLCDFRDNVLARNHLLLSLVKRALKIRTLILRRRA